jgi:hypothetical protein
MGVARLAAMNWHHLTRFRPCLQWVQLATEVPLTWQSCLIWENVLGMTLRWRLVVERQTETRCYRMGSVPEALAPRERLYFLNGESDPNAAEHALPASVLCRLPAAPLLHLDLPGRAGPQQRTRLRTLTTKVAGETLLNRLNCLPSSPPATAVKEADEWNVVRSTRHSPWRVLTAQEMLRILALPPTLLDPLPNLTPAEYGKMVGESMDVRTVLRAIYSRRDELQSYHRINAALFFNGLGASLVALAHLHAVGILKLGTVVIVEIDARRTEAVLAWFHAQPELAGVQVEVLGDIRDISDCAFVDLARRIGGFHLMIGGFPCNNTSGSNHHTDGERGRVGLDGEHSGLFIDMMRLALSVQHVALLWPVLRT